MARVVEVAGQKYEFPDDAPDEAVMAFVNKHAPKPATMLDVVKAIPSNVMNNMAKGTEGALSMMGDVGLATGNPAQVLLVQAGKQLVKPGGDAAKAAAKADTPQNMSTAQEIALAGGSSVLSAVPDLMLGAGTAKAAQAAGASIKEALTAGANAGLTTMAAREGTGEYQAQLDAGRTSAQAIIPAGVQAAAEFLPEKYGATKLIDAMSGGQLKKRLASFLFTDLAGEELTTAVEWVNRKLSRDPNTTLNDLAHEALITAGATAVSGPMQGGLGRVMYTAAVKDQEQAIQAGRPKVEPTEVQPPIPVEPPPPESPRRTTYVNDATLPIIGTPENTQAIPRQIPERVLQRLRDSYAAQSQGSFQDTAEDKIRRKGDFQKARAAAEELLKFDPEARALLRADDLATGLKLPDLNTELEQEVDDWATLTPEQILTKQEARVEDPGTLAEDANYAPQMPDDLRAQVDPTGAGTSMNEPYSGFIVPHVASNSEHINAPGLTVQQSTNPDLVGKPFKEAAQTMQPGEVVYMGQRGMENKAGASYLVDIISNLTRTFLPNARIVIAEDTDPGSGRLSAAWKVSHNTYAFNLPRVGWARKGWFDRFLNLAGPNKQFRFDEDTLSALDTAMHEFTHIIHFNHWATSSAQEKKSVAEEYHADLRFALQANVNDAVRRLYSPKTADAMLKSYYAQGGKATDAFDSNMAHAKLQPWSDSKYWFNFNEWMAHKGLKYFTTRLGVARENVPFFRRLVQKLAEVYKQVARTYFTFEHKAFEQWMDNIVARESGMRDLVEEVDTRPVPNTPEWMNARLQMARPSDATRAKLEESNIAATPLAQVDPSFLLTSYQLHNMVGKARSTITKWAQDAQSLLIGDLLHAPEFNNPENFDSYHFAAALVRNLADPPTKLQDGSYMFGEAVQLGFNWEGRTISFTPEVQAEPALVAAALYTYAQESGSGNFILGQPLKQFAPEAQQMFKELREGTSGGKIRYAVPHWAFEDVPSPATGMQEVEMRVPAALATLGRRLGVFGSVQSSTALGRFNWLFGKALDAFKLIAINESVPGMLQEREALRNRMTYRHTWIRNADATLQKWLDSVPKEQANKLAKLLYSETANGTSTAVMQSDPNKPGHYIYVLPAATLTATGLSLEAAEVYSMVRNDFHRFSDEWNKVGLWEIARSELPPTAQYALSEAMRRELPMQDYRKLFDSFTAAVTVPQASQRVADRAKNLNDQFDVLAEKPYMPFTRFGRYGILVRDSATNETLYFEGFDNTFERDQALPDMARKFHGHAVSATYLEDSAYELAGMPPALLDAMAKRMNLTQDQQDELSEVLKKLSFANSFAHRMAHRAGVEGYSMDAIRAYSDYFRRGAGFMARVKSAPELSDAMKVLAEYINGATKQVNNEPTDVTKLGQLHEYFTKLHEWLDSPQQEYGEVKSLVALFHFGFNAMTAAWNLTQVPFVTLPYLSARYGMGESTKALTTAYKDLKRVWGYGKPLPSDEEAMLSFALDAGFRDQSQATVLAQIADGGAMSRSSPAMAWQRGLNRFNHAAMWMFSKGELINRDATLLASYRLAKSGQPYHGAFDRAAFDEARNVVEQTHNEYGAENRPVLARGAAGVIFQFMHYPITMAFLMMGGDKSWWRIALTQLMFAGALGMPFAGDMVNAAKFLGRKVFGKDWDGEREARLYLSELNANPDLVLRGITSDLLGFDLSSRMSLGDLVPGMQAVGSHKKFNDVLSNAAGDVAGPAGSVLLNMLNFVAQDDKGSWEKLRKVMPSAARYLGDGVKAFKEGSVKDASGAKIMDASTWDVLGIAVGARPKEVAQEYTARTLVGEQGTFWIQRRSNLLKMGQKTFLDRAGDREASSDFIAQVVKYNKEIPDPALRLTITQIRSGVKKALEQRVMKEAGLGGDKKTQSLYTDIKDTFTE